VLLVAFEQSNDESPEWNINMELSPFRKCDILLALDINAIVNPLGNARSGLLFPGGNAIPFLGKQ
jgi:hypothetical protein